MDSALFIDIETIKDKTVLGADWPDSKWPPPIGWKGVAIGMLIATFDSSRLGSITVSDMGCMIGDEEQILLKFWDYFGKKAGSGYYMEWARLRHPRTHS